MEQRLNFLMGELFVGRALGLPEFFFCQPAQLFP